MSKPKTKRGSPPGTNRGGGLPPIGPHTSVRILIPIELLARIDQASDGNRSEWIREVARERLDTNPDTTKQS